jgi:hypothetical protein
MKNLLENDLLNKYDRFIITRSDYIYQLPHPKIELMNETNIWIPDCEHYGGIRTDMSFYLNIILHFI